MQWASGRGGDAGRGVAAGRGGDAGRGVANIGGGEAGKGMDNTNGEDGMGMATVREAGRGVAIIGGGEVGRGVANIGGRGYKEHRGLASTCTEAWLRLARSKKGVASTCKEIEKAWLRLTKLQLAGKELRRGFDLS